MNETQGATSSDKFWPCDCGCHNLDNEGLRKRISELESVIQVDKELREWAGRQMCDQIKFFADRIEMCGGECPPCLARKLMEGKP